MERAAQSELFQQSDLKTEMLGKDLENLVVLILAKQNNTIYIVEDPQLPVFSQVTR